jgi:hypothetical protein
MKKVVLIILLVALILLSSCAPRTFNPEKGLENFDKNDSEFSLCQYIMPDGFIEKYDYKDGNYYSIETGSIYNGTTVDRAFIYIQYDAEIYDDAKICAIENLSLSNEAIHEYNGYYFFLNHSSSVDDIDYLDGRNFPYKFLSFAYNDSTNTLVFFGLYISSELKNQTIEEAEDWPAFLEKYYGEWYSFS